MLRRLTLISFRIPCYATSSWPPVTYVILRQIKHTWCNIDVAMLLALTSFLRVLRWESWVLVFLLYRVLKTTIPLGQNEKRLALLQIPSWLPQKNVPKYRIWTLAILNNLQCPQGRSWRRYHVLGPKNMGKLFFWRTIEWICGWFLCL